jgi:hypothetical protein
LALAAALLAGALLGAAPALALAAEAMGEPSEDSPPPPGHEKAPDLETAFPPSARPGPVEATPDIDPSEATMDLPEAIMRGLGLHEEKTPAQLAEERKKKFHWNAVPFVLTSPLIGFGFGVAGAGVFRLDDEGARLSKFATNVLYTVNKQLSIPLRTSIYFGGGDWSLVGYTNWQIFPAPTWGLGGNTPSQDEVIVDKSLIRIWETAFPPAARPGPVEEPPAVDPTDATTDLAEVIVRGLGLYVPPTPEEAEAARKQKFHWNAS